MATTDSADAAASSGWFVTGSDTGVGKSWVTVQLLRRLVAHGVRAVGFKPIACGDREDGVALLAAGDPSAGLTLDEVNPWLYQAPASPYTAAVIERRPLDWHLLDAAWERLLQRADTVLVEGAGGIMTPVDAAWTMRDLAVRWHLNALVVVPNRLGALSQALCAVECLAARHIHVDAVILNPLDVVDEAVRRTNVAVLEERLPSRVFEADTEGLDLLADTLANAISSRQSARNTLRGTPLMADPA